MDSILQDRSSESLDLRWSSNAPPPHARNSPLPLDVSART